MGEVGICECSGPGFWGNPAQPFPEVGTREEEEWGPVVSLDLKLSHLSGAQWGVWADTRIYRGLHWPTSGEQTFSDGTPGNSSVCEDLGVSHQSCGGGSGLSEALQVTGNSHQLKMTYVKR